MLVRCVFVNFRMLSSQDISGKHADCCYVLRARSLVLTCAFTVIQYLVSYEDVKSNDL